MVDGSSTAIRRHRNPVGIVVRIFVFPWMGVALWRHRRWPLVVGTMIEVGLWTIVPPVEKGPAAVDAAIEVELDWLNAPLDARKVVSWAALGAFPGLLGTGLWRHSPRLLAAGTASAVTFNLLMHHIARRRDSEVTQEESDPGRVPGAAAPDPHR